MKSNSNIYSTGQDFSFLSVRDLLTARDLYHRHLVHKANVVATAVGRYLIRKTDPWPSAQKNGKGGSIKSPRTLENSEVRPYSWPAIIVFVDQWAPENAFGSALKPEDKVPPALYLPDGKTVPVCVVLAPAVSQPEPPANSLIFPKNLIGGGYPLLVDVQGQEHFGSVACLVTDGHLTYALTCRHVSGRPGEIISSVLNAEHCEVGVSSPKQLTRVPFSDVYPELPGNHVYVNLDVGLVEVDDREEWTSQVFGLGEIGELADVDIESAGLKLIGAPVVGYGAASRKMEGLIHALFYRYKEIGGTEYITDFLIGPRAGQTVNTHPGDSGTLWALEDGLRPLAIQWGGHVFLSGQSQTKASYALASSLSVICDALEVDLVRDWGIGLPYYWGSFGHYEIANQAVSAISDGNLGKLMKNNLTRISFDQEDITAKGVSGLSKKPFVPLADVPDLVWKIGKYNRGQPEHPNHFADMDKPRPSDQKTLLDLCDASLTNVDVNVWLQYYNDVGDASKGLLPFRVWQFYQAMVEFVKQGDARSFVCAAGIVSHYVGDACQPLHISYMFNGDPNDSEMEDVKDRFTGKTSRQAVPRAAGVHSAYEDAMVNRHGEDIKKGVTAAVGRANALPVFQGGKGAADAVVALMQKTFATIAPKAIVDKYLELKSGKPAVIADGLWDEFGSDTIKVMTLGSVALANIWDSAWKEGGGSISTFGAISEEDLEALYQTRSFMTSYTLDKIGPILAQGASTAGTSAPVLATTRRRASEPTSRGAGPKSPSRRRKAKH